MSFDLVLYRLQDPFYYLVLALFITRWIINSILYDKVQSYNVHPNVPDLWKYRQFTPAEKEEIIKRNPHIRDPNHDGENDKVIQFMLYTFTFWWPFEYKESDEIARLKRRANILNITFAFLLILTCVLYLYMQEVNWRFEEQHITRSFWALFK